MATHSTVLYSEGVFLLGSNAERKLLFKTDTLETDNEIRVNSFLHKCCWNFLVFVILC